jgi:hypothetical protein
MRIGELLTEQKESLGHGEFTAWVKENLPFTVRTAQNYMRIWNERETLKSETVLLLGSYRLLRGGLSILRKLLRKITLKISS